MGRGFGGKGLGSMVKEDSSEKTKISPSPGHLGDLAGQEQSHLPGQTKSPRTHWCYGRGCF